MEEGVSASDIIDQQRTNCSLVVGSGDCLERFLSCCIPYLDFDGFVFDLNGFASEFNAYGELVLVAKFVIGELEEKTGFANCHIATRNKQNKERR